MNDGVLLLLRLGFAGLLLGFHGVARAGRAFEYLTTGEPWPFVAVVAQLGLPFAPGFALASVLTESVGAVLVAAGLWTRTAAAAIAINMGVAIYNEVRKGDPMELAALYLLGAVVIGLSGAGRYSLDRRLARGRAIGRR